MSNIIGIDLGTTNSAYAYPSASGTAGAEILENNEGFRTTPSFLALSKTGDRLVGLPAKRQAVTNAKNTVYGVKRFIGHKFNDKEVARDREFMPYEMKEGKEGSISVVLGDKDYTPEELSAMILSKIKKDAEERLGGPVTEAVITVPAYFNDAQRKATKDAGTIAGLEVKRIINEPTAAALAYGLNKKKNEKIVVFDFGGGTFDISVLEVGDGVIEVKATDGDSHMGGKDIDRSIIEYLVSTFKNQTGIDIGKDSLALQRLNEEAEKAKIELSQSLTTTINIPFITSTSDGPLHLEIELTRSKVEDLASDFINRSIEITKRAVESSPFSLSDIDEIVLVGGQTRMPKITEKVKELFKKEPNKSINPDEVVALGAAIQAGILRGDVQDVLLLDVIPISFGIETEGGVATKLLEKNTTIPTSYTQTFSTAGDNQTAVTIHVIQGERPMATDNKSLGQFTLEGIPTGRRGEPQIEVTFDINADGILEVKAKDKKTNKEKSIRIEAASNLSEEEIQKMTADAETHKEEDEKKREIVEVKNMAEQAIYSAKNVLNEAEEGNKKTELENSIKALEESLKNENKEDIEQKTKDLIGLVQTVPKKQTPEKEQQEGDKNTSETEQQESDKNTPETEAPPEAQDEK